MGESRNLKNTINDTDKRKYRTLTNTINRKAKFGSENYYNNIYSETEKKIHHGNMEPGYKMAKTFFEKQSNKVSGVSITDGNILND